MQDPQNSSRNRGFAFVEYYNHACADYSRQRMSRPKFKLDDNAPTVSWADPKSADTSASQVFCLCTRTVSTLLCKVNLVDSRTKKDVHKI